MNTEMFPSSWLRPTWPVSDKIVAFTTSRDALDSAHSQEPLTGYQSFNLALHVNDDKQIVEKNRLALASLCELGANQFHWLEQIHSNKVVKAGRSTINAKADASYTSQKRQACIVMTADCLPVLFCNKQETQVAAAHAGWRGLATGILSNTVKAFDSAPQELVAWLGPAISQQAFEVGNEVYEAFCERHAEAAKAFIPGANTGKWHADLYQLARIELEALGVSAIYGGERCSFNESEYFYSYRRDGAQSGRMASVIYIR